MGTGDSIGRRTFNAGLAAALAAMLGCRRMEVAQAQPAQNGRQLRLLGEVRSRVVRAGDTLERIARAEGLGYTELLAANPGIDPWLPTPRARLVLPTAHLVPDIGFPGILVSLTQQRLFFAARAGAAPVSFPIGIGQAGSETPVGRTRVVGKRENPYWTVPETLRRENPDLPAVMPPGPDNPLGSHALDLAWPGYVIHGTNRPYGVGRRVSHGCIRLYPEDIVRLYPEVPEGMPVTIIDDPAIVGWVDGNLYMEVHPNQTEADEIESAGRLLEPGNADEPIHLVRQAAGARWPDVDWRKVIDTARDRRGVPQAVLTH